MAVESLGIFGLLCITKILGDPLNVFIDDTKNGEQYHVTLQSDQTSVLDLKHALVEHVHTPPKWQVIKYQREIKDNNINLVNIQENNEVYLNIDLKPYCKKLNVMMTVHGLNHHHEFDFDRDHHDEPLTIHYLKELIKYSFGFPLLNQAISAHPQWIFGEELNDDTDLIHFFGDTLTLEIKKVDYPIHGFVFFKETNDLLMSPPLIIPYTDDLASLIRAELQLSWDHKPVIYIFYQRTSDGSIHEMFDYTWSGFDPDNADKLFYVIQFTEDDDMEKTKKMLSQLLSKEKDELD